jgi:antitoxin CcdA
MHAVRDARRAAGKKAVNVTVDAALVEEARKHEINLSATLEHALEEALRQARRQRWLDSNAAAITAYNEQVDEHGVFSDTLRSF